MNLNLTQWKDFYKDKQINRMLGLLEKNQKMKRDLTIAFLTIVLSNILLVFSAFPDIVTYIGLFILFIVLLASLYFEDIKNKFYKKNILSIDVQETVKAIDENVTFSLLTALEYHQMAIESPENSIEKLKLFYNIQIQYHVSKAITLLYSKLNSLSASVGENTINIVTEIRFRNIISMFEWLVAECIKNGDESFKDMYISDVSLKTAIRKIKNKTNIN